MLRHAVETEKISHAISSVSSHITVSVGTATVHFTELTGEQLRNTRAGKTCEHTVESLMIQADQHLYKAKQNGRNRVWP